MKTILLDMDGVIVDLLPWWLRTIARNTGVHAQVEDVTDWKLHRAKPFVDAKLSPNQIYDRCFDSATFWEDAPAVPGMLDVCFDLRSEENEGRCRWAVVSTPANSVSASGKHKWIERTLGKMAVQNNLILTAKKEFVLGDVLVDDRDDNVVEYLHAHRHARAIVPVYPYLDKSKLLRFGTRVKYTTTPEEMCAAIRAEISL